MSTYGNGHHRVHRRQVRQQVRHGRPSLRYPLHRGRLCRLILQHLRQRVPQVHRHTINPRYTKFPFKQLHQCSCLLSRMCILGKRLLKDINVLTDCNKNVSGVLHQIYCGNSTTKCDPYYVENNVTIVNGIRGLASGVFLGRHLRTWSSSDLQMVDYIKHIGFTAFREHLEQFPRRRPTDRLWKRSQGHGPNGYVFVQPDPGRSYHYLHHSHRYLLPFGHRQVVTKFPIVSRNLAISKIEHQRD